MEIFFENSPIEGIKINNTDTLGYVKNVIKNWLSPTGFNYNIMVTFSDGSRLDNKVFDTVVYDHMNLEGHGEGGRIDIERIHVKEKKVKYKIRITDGNDDENFFFMYMTMTPSNMVKMLLENGGPGLAQKLGFVKLSLEEIMS